ncbi:hypothetical protein [Croceicoccus marinus]|jgi:hypothetical protein|uniref:Uncharacterized protein n=1 Tax=Croceicoccus marinus TaxID=450378 RepID=A0A7G6VW16_9SPHN|nr:hypothetical protein [Croceicoccus marinus]QNE05931.1 hypothetical protein H4O24_04545 [Croceicoccus marinus]
MHVRRSDSRDRIDLAERMFRHESQAQQFADPVFAVDAKREGGLVLPPDVGRGDHQREMVRAFALAPPASGCAWAGAGMAAENAPAA